MFRLMLRESLGSTMSQCAIQSANLQYDGSATVGLHDDNSQGFAMLRNLGSVSSDFCSAGNINQLILKVDSYVQSLEETQGIIAEFVNPKYKDASKTAFKSSTRLECMMQDYPRALPPSAAVGFTVVNQVGCIT